METGRDTFCLDATAFRHRGLLYFVWAQKDPQIAGNSNLYIAPMASPTRLAGEPVLLSRPEYDWEIQGFLVNEGPAVLARHGKVFLSYSASATDDRYCMGLLRADEGADLLYAAELVQVAAPVFETCASRRACTARGTTASRFPRTAARTCSSTTRATTRRSSATRCGIRIVTPTCSRLDGTSAACRCSDELPGAPRAEHQRHRSRPGDDPAGRHVLPLQHRARHCRPQLPRHEDLEAGAAGVRASARVDFHDRPGLQGPHLGAGHLGARRHVLPLLRDLAPRKDHLGDRRGHQQNTGSHVAGLPVAGSRHGAAVRRRA